MPLVWLPEPKRKKKPGHDAENNDPNPLNNRVPEPRKIETAFLLEHIDVCHC